ncbi:2',5' RNA ligase family [Microbulbifer aggregans]|uniref:RNA 2',3'-cyclic phosphodiesterase n=1 Tax=Microbulbifer aggregans TaxID=1769779 RepID=A0A1C9W945_9GAMM|nr:RNA 2',3'-cyclic phosphodiesterase [Microbulbifer aggregans]AOS97660.1 2',5' RNA ligase family [Microbulbifer aggregans]
MGSKQKREALADPRLFIGIRPTADTQLFLDSLVNHCRQQLGQSAERDVRWTSQANRHLTLAFLGETPAELIPPLEAGILDIADRIQACQARVVTLQPFPKSRSRLLAAELLPNPDLDRLHECCRGLMKQLDLEPESAAYRPHFTLGRNRRGFSRLPPVMLDRIVDLDNIVLYQSRMTPGGSQYHPLLEAELSGPAQSG